MRTRGRRAMWLAAGLAAALAGGGIVPAAEGATPKVTLDSFQGSCALQGLVKFTPPANSTVRPLRVAVEGTGTCTGTMNGK